jgi:hypothetical protein
LLECGEQGDLLHGSQCEKPRLCEQRADACTPSDLSREPRVGQRDGNRFSRSTSRT